MSARIIFLNRSFYPDITATGQLLTELCEDLVKDYKCRVTVIAGKPLIAPRDYVRKGRRGIILEKEDHKGIEILRVKSFALSPRSFLGRVMNYLSYFFLSLAASFKLEKPDLVVTLTDPPIIGLVGLWISLRFGIPYIISVRDIFPEAARGLSGDGNQVVNLLLDYTNRFCLKRSKLVVVLGQIMRQRLIEKGIAESKISVIPDWADCSNIFPVPKKNSFSIANNLAEYFVVMYAGNIGASAGLDSVIESAYLLKDYDNILFVFIGEGIMKEKLKNMAIARQSNNVRFFSYQPKEILSEVFSSADIFVIPLKKGLAGYSLPSKIYTVMASGRPYIACVEEESEIAQITKKYNCGLLARPEDCSDLKEKIMSLYNNEELRVGLGGNARKAASFFDRAIGVKSYHELFQRLS